MAKKTTTKRNPVPPLRSAGINRTSTYKGYIIRGPDFGGIFYITKGNAHISTASSLESAQEIISMLTDTTNFPRMRNPVAEWAQSGGIHIDIGTDNKGGRTRVNPVDPEYFSFIVHRGFIEWRSSSGRHGTDPTKRPAVTLAKLVRQFKLGNGDYEVLKAGSMFAEPRATGLMQSRKKNPSTWGVPSRQRKVAEFAANDRVAKIYYTSDLGEYQVKYWMGGIRQEPWDYFTDDLDDAKSTAQTALRFENPANSPALGMSKAAYINRKSQITKKAPVKRLKKRRNYAYLMAQRGFKGAFPNPIGESKWQWIDYDVWGNAEDGYEVNQAFSTTHKIMLKDDAKLTDMLKALRASGVLGSKATTKSVSIEDHEDAIYFNATEDGYPLGELRKIG